MSCAIFSYLYKLLLPLGLYAVNLVFFHAQMCAVLSIKLFTLLNCFIYELIPDLLSGSDSLHYNKVFTFKCQQILQTSCKC